LALPVVIFERFQVERLEIKTGPWMGASAGGFSRDRPGVARRTISSDTKKARWELRKNSIGWEAVAPADRTYVPSDVAVRNFGGATRAVDRRR